MGYTILSLRSNESAAKQRLIMNERNITTKSAIKIPAGPAALLTKKIFQSNTNKNGINENTKAVIPDLFFISPFND